MSYCYVTGAYNQYPSHHGPQYAQSSSNFEQEGNSIQNFPPAPIDFLHWDGFFTSNTNSVAQVSTTRPIQTNISSAVPLLPHSYFDTVANSSRALPVAAPVPVPHAALTKAALRNMMSFDDKGNIFYRIPFDKETDLAWTHHLQDKENHTHNNFAGDSEPQALNITDTRTRVDFDNHGGRRVNRQAAMNWPGHYLQDKENLTHNNNFAGGREFLKIADTRTRVDFDNHGRRANRRAAMNSNALMNPNDSKQTTTGVTGRSKSVIRPISPSTLMALTEPCLMAWCTASDDSLTEPGPSVHLPLQSSDHNNYVDNKMVYNAWGY